MFNFIKSVFIAILSLIIIFIYKFKKKNIVHFTSIKKINKNYLDPRTISYLNPSKTIFIIRSQNFLYSLLAFLKYRNTIFFNFIFNINYSIGKILFIKKKDIDKFNLNFISNIFKFLKVKEFHMLDDYRNVELFSKICKKNNIKFLIYQHGRFTSALKIQKKIKKISFNRYFVWSNFFKKKLMEFNKNFDEKNILIKKKFSYKINLKEKKSILSKKIIIIHERGIKESDYEIVIKKLIMANKKYKIFFKFRNNDNIQLTLKNILEKYDIKMFHTENIYGLIKKYKFDCLIGFNTTLLLEASYFNICPVMIYKSKPYLKDYVNEKVFFKSTLKVLDKNIINFLKKNKSIKSFRKKVWG